MGDIIQPTILGISISVITIYISTKIAISLAVGNLERIRNYTLYKIAQKNNQKTIKEFLKILYKKGNILFYEPDRSNKPLLITFILFLFMSIVAIFSPSLTTIYANHEYFIYPLYSASCAILLFFIWYDFKYYKQFFLLEKEYPIPTDFENEMCNKIIVNIDIK